MKAVQFKKVSCSELQVPKQESLLIPLLIGILNTKKSLVVRWVRLKINGWTHCEETVVQFSFKKFSVLT